MKKRRARREGDYNVICLSCLWNGCVGGKYYVQKDDSEITLSTNDNNNKSMS